MRPDIRLGLVATSALSLALPVHGAHAQAVPAAPPGALEEVVVTATRQADTVSHVAVSVEAVTQRKIDDQGIKTIADFVRATPSVNIRRQGVDNTADISIRGLTSHLGSSTTAVYLDDIPLQKRGVNGLSTGNGTPTPNIFDLDRIEVLRGPQGTLFGSSSEGGTIRFITPAPSLTKYSAVVRAEASTIEQGSPGYEFGFAVGGPIVDGKLGFRLSAEDRHVGGYIDHVSLYDAHAIGKDTNYEDQQTVHLSVIWSPTDKLKIQPSFFYSFWHQNDQNTFWNDIPQYSVNPGWFTNLVHIGAANTGFNYQLDPHFYAGGTYGPFNQYGPYKSGVGLYYDTAHNASLARGKRNNALLLPTLTIDYDFGPVSVKSITGYLDDKTWGVNVSGAGLRGGNFNVTNPTYVTDLASMTPVPGGFGSSPNLVWNGVPYNYFDYEYKNYRNQLTQEFRLTSAPGKRLTYVAGLYYNTSHLDQPVSVTSNEDLVHTTVRGIEEAYAVNIPMLAGTIFHPVTPATTQISTPAPVFIGNRVYPGQQVATPTYYIGNGGTQVTPGVDVARVQSIFRESELAAFAEGNYLLTDKLKFTAGVRVSHFDFSAYQMQSGPVYGSPYAAAGATPTAANFVPTPTHPFPDGVTDPYQNVALESIKETPVNPKVGISYQATPNDLYYFTVSRGYRAGGVNTPGTLAQCVNDIAALGGPTPLDYKSDSVTNYELGAKVKLFGNSLQLNTSAYYIDWQDPQLTVTLRCAFQYVTNAKGAASKGFDADFQWRLFNHFTLNGTVAYTDARYTQDFSFTSPSGTIYIVKKGQNLGAPDWQYNIGGQFDTMLLGGKYRAYVRADYQYSAPYLAGALPGEPGYDPVTAKAPQTHYASMRAGVQRDSLEAALFVNNLTNSQDLLTKAHGQSSPLVSGTTFRPREVGIQLIWRY